LAVFTNIARKIERAIVRDHSFSVSGDLKTEHPTADKPELQPHRFSVHATIEDVAVRADRVEPHN